MLTSSTEQPHLCYLSSLPSWLPQRGLKASRRPEPTRFLYVNDVCGGQINISPAGVTYTPSGVSQVIHVSGSEKIKLVASWMTFTIKAYSIEQKNVQNDRFVLILLSYDLEAQNKYIMFNVSVIT